MRVLITGSSLAVHFPTRSLIYTSVWLLDL